jgi:hypothetical protein
MADTKKPSSRRRKWLIADLCVVCLVIIDVLIFFNWHPVGFSLTGHLIALFLADSAIGSFLYALVRIFWGRLKMTGYTLIGMGFFFALYLPYLYQHRGSSDFPVIPGLLILMLLPIIVVVVPIWLGLFLVRCADASKKKSE